jgi:nucleotide-binding universal stress UspA family protein
MLEGTVTALYEVPPPLPIPQDSTAAFATEMVEIWRDEVSAATDAAERFRHWSRQCGVAVGNWRVVDGDGPSALEFAAMWSDILVLERPQAELSSLRQLGQALLHARVPCLIVPSDFSMPTFNTIVLAFKDTLESTRTLHASLPLLERAKRIVVVHGERGVPREESEAAAARVDQHLLTHGLCAERRCIDADAQTVGSTLLAVAEDVSADLLVMGAYGRARFSEWLFGGATRHVLQAAKLPVFMRH